MNSMRARLLIILLATTGAVWLSAAGWIYFSTRAHVEQVLDARLREAARMVSSMVTDDRVQLASAADAVSVPEFARHPGEVYTRQLSCQIWSMSGQLVGRSESAPGARLADGGDGFSLKDIDGQTWRVFTEPNPERGVQVMVGDNMHMRDALVNDVMMGTLLPMTLFLPVGALVIWLSVRRGLRPLDEMAAALSSRHESDLQPVGLDDLPGELRPVLRAVNGLLGRVGSAREREKSFTAFAAHELKTPLAGLKTQAQIALASPDHETRTHALSQIAGGVDRSARMVRQLLDLAAADSGEPDAGQSNAAIAQIVAEALASVESLRSRRKATIRLEGDQGGALAANPMLAATALRNVLENALIHSPEGGVIDVAVRLGAGHVAVVVCDAGPGMSEADLARAGERFFRGRAASGEGSGLGLAIVEAVMKRAGGAMQIANRDGGGLEVTLTFPARQA